MYWTGRVFQRTNLPCTHLRVAPMLASVSPDFRGDSETLLSTISSESSVWSRRGDQVWQFLVVGGRLSYADVHLQLDAR